MRGTANAASQKLCKLCEEVIKNFLLAMTSNISVAAHINFAPLYAVCGNLNISFCLPAPLGMLQCMWRRLPPNLDPLLCQHIPSTGRHSPLPLPALPCPAPAPLRWARHLHLCAPRQPGKWHNSVAGKVLTDADAATMSLWRALCLPTSLPLSLSRSPCCCCRCMGKVERWILMFVDCHRPSAHLFSKICHQV